MCYSKVGVRGIGQSMGKFSISYPSVYLCLACELGGVLFIEAQGSLVIIRPAVGSDGALQL